MVVQSGMRDILINRTIMAYGHDDARSKFKGRIVVSSSIDIYEVRAYGPDFIRAYAHFYYNRTVMFRRDAPKLRGTLFFNRTIKVSYTL